MTNDLIAQAEAALDGVTPGEWHPCGWNVMSGPLDVCDAASDNDARFIAWCRAGVPALIARIRELEGEREKDGEEILDLRFNLEAAEAKLAEVEKAAQENDPSNLWRFWSQKSQALANKLAEVEKERDILQENRDEAVKLWSAAEATVATLTAQGVRVKPLVWTAREDLNGLHEACGADGLYRNVWDQKNGTWVYEGDPTANPPTQARFPTLDAAKAAAQADYERRILAALAPAEAGGVELETCGKCMGSGYGGHPDSGAVCHVCGGSGGETPAPVDALVKAAEDVDDFMRGQKAYERSGYGPKLRAALAAYRGGAK